MRLKSESLHYPIIGGRTFRLNRDIQVYVVKRGRSPVVPSQMAAYESVQVTFPSFIFIRDEPDKITPLGRFFVYHEFGHASWRQQDTRITSRFGWEFFLFPLPWVIISLQFNPISLVGLVLYVLLLTTTYPIYRYLLQISHFFEEINADRFARSFLSCTNQKALAEYLSAAGQLPKDSSMNDEQNLERSKRLLQDLRKEENSSGPNSPRVVYAYPIGIICLQLLFAIFILIMGFLNRPPSIVFLCCNFMFLTILFGILIWLFEKRSRLREEIKSYLSETNH